MPGVGQDGVPDVEKPAEARRRAQEEAMRRQLGDDMRSKKAILVSEDGSDDGEEARVLDLRHARGLDAGARKALLDRVMETQDMDNSTLLAKVKARLDRVGLELPAVEVVFQDVSVSAEAFVATRAVPSIPNYFLDLAEAGLRLLRLAGRNPQKVDILQGVRGRLQPGRFTLLLGPPGSGKSSLLKVLAGKLQGGNLKVEGSVTYNGYGLDEFVVQRTAAYIDQEDNHLAPLSVRETLDFAARCQGAGFDELREVRQRERALGVEPDWEVDAFMKAASLRGKQHSLMSDYVLRMLGLEICEHTIIGDQLVRGISGGQKKRVTTAEMVVSPKRVLLADEISTGLDSSTTFQLVRCLRAAVRLRASTVLVSLLQPPPETFELFDDVMLLSEGQLVYHGPREHVLEFFAELGFRLPERKGVADFLQEVTSRKDQRQFWSGKRRDWRYVSVLEFAAAFRDFHVGQKLAGLRPPQRTEQGRAALAHSRHALSWGAAFKACLRREYRLMLHNSFLYAFRFFQIALVAFMTGTLYVKPRMRTDTFEGGVLYIQVLFFSAYLMVVSNFSELAISVNQLGVFFKHRDALFFPTTAYVLPTSLLRLPYSALNSLLWAAIVYWAVGLAPSAGRFFIYLGICFLTHTLAVTQFRAIASLTRSLVLANITAFLAVLLVFLLGGYIVPKRSVPPWWRWAVWCSPMFYATEGLAINEFHAPRWSSPFGGNPAVSLGAAVLGASDLNRFGLFILVCAGALAAFSVAYNLLIIAAMNALSSPDSKRAVLPAAVLASKTGVGKPESASRLSLGSAGAESGRSLSQPSRAFLEPAAQPPPAQPAQQGQLPTAISGGSADEGGGESVGMTLPFQPMLLTFTDICYYVPMPAAMSKEKRRLQKLRSLRSGERKQARERERQAREAQPHAGKLQLLDRIDGVFAPGVLTALMGTTGAGKTTLMDVLAGRKTAGSITGDIRVNGFPQELRTFKRVSGYCEQTDLHSPQCTVGEALWFSARLRLAPEVPAATMRAFVAEIMELVELTPIAGALVGRPGVSGLSVERRKRLTIAVELVANPSIVFMDEPTSGLDARAAAIVMRVVRNICSTGRTICCTIHQPSIDVFEAFDELVLLKRGGSIIYSGSLGPRSGAMVAYFQAIPGVPRIADGFNPATWMLDISTVSAEARLGTDLAHVYRESELYTRNRERIAARAQPEPGAQPLAFATEFAQPQWKQYCLLLWKHHVLYWRTPDYTAVRIVFSLLLGLLFGTVLWADGQDRSSRESVQRIIAAQYLVVVFYGFTNSATVQPIVSYERLVFYRERFAGMYGSLPYALAQADVELPYLLGQSIVYSAVTYWMIRYEYSAAKFFWYLLFMTLSLAYYTFYGMMIVSLTDTIATASTVSVIAYAVWNLLAGFLIPRPDVPGWWLWLFYLNPAHWSFYGLVVGQLGDVPETISSTTAGDASSLTSVSAFLETTYGLHHSFIGWVALILVGFCLCFRATTVIAICKLQFGKR